MRRLLAVATLACILTSAYAQSQVSPMSLVGRWSMSASHPSGATLITHVILTQNLRFFGSSTADGKTFFEFAGTWSVSGNTLVWRYETSSGVFPAPGTTDTDEIVSVDATKLVLRSALSGKQNEYIRNR